VTRVTPQILPPVSPPRRAANIMVEIVPFG
jgi:hypothetical protein